MIMNADAMSYHLGSDYHLESYNLKHLENVLNDFESYMKILVKISGNESK